MTRKVLQGKVYEPNIADMPRVRTILLGVVSKLGTSIQFVGAYIT